MVCATLLILSSSVDSMTTFIFHRSNVRGAMYTAAPGVCQADAAFFEQTLVAFQPLTLTTRFFGTP